MRRFLVWVLAGILVSFGSGASAQETGTTTDWAGSYYGGAVGFVHGVNFHS